jgi:hypothetical protein
VSPGTTTTDWRRENARWLRLALRHLRLRLHQYALRCAETDPPAVGWLVAADEAELAHFNSGGASEAVDSVGRELGACEQRMLEAGRLPALRALEGLLGLSALESDLLLLSAAPSIDGTFGFAYGQLQGDTRRTYATLQLALSLSVSDPAERVIAGDCLMPSRPLRSLRLIDVDADESEPLLTRRLSVDERMTDYLRGANRIDVRIDHLLASLPAALQSETAVQAGVAAADLIAGDEGHWTTVNLIGQLERGAGEAVQAACSRLGLWPRVINLPRLAAHAPSERAAIITLVGREACLGRVAVVLDTSQSPPAGDATPLINEVIGSVSATLFVVSAERWPSEQQLAAVRVSAPTRDEQRALWCSALNGHAYEMNGDIDTIVQQFDFGNTAIADVVARVGRSGARITSSDLWRACREQTGTALEGLAHRLTPCYGWEDLVVGQTVRAQLTEIASQVQQRCRVYEAWGFGAKLARGRGITAVFAGPSGTGKTMAAEILAGHLELDLYRIDLAGIVSKYVGETEKNLRRVFDAAERSGAILFFDEADALFGTRTEVRDSHDRYANFEINYLLQRMEDYTGLAILATNRRSALDPAFLRRLRFVVDFPFPGVEDRRRIWERAFPPLAPTERLELTFLSKLDLSGGNIKSIALNAAFLAAAERSPISMPIVVRAAAREYAKLSKPVSAADFGAYYAVAQP